MGARILITSLLLAASANLMAEEPGYRLSVESSVRDNKLKVVPFVTGPAGAMLRYELISTKLGSAGKSNTAQSGRVAVGLDGSVKLSTLTLSVRPQDRYSISITVFDGQKVVAEQTLHHPQ